MLPLRQPIPCIAQHLPATVVAEGAESIEQKEAKAAEAAAAAAGGAGGGAKTDASGNRILDDVGEYLKGAINA